MMLWIGFKSDGQTTIDYPIDNCNKLWIGFKSDGQTTDIIIQEVGL